MDFVPTKGSLLKKKPAENFEVVTFEAYKSKSGAKKGKKEIKNEESEGNKSEVKQFNIKQAKFEVMKFGMSGFDAKKKQDAKIQLAIRLGAKPPKNKYKNYKELLKEKKEEKAKLKADLEFQELGKNGVGKSSARTKFTKRKNKDKSDDILDIYGQVKSVPKKR